jgi:Flp pilus assembly protein protease CpaA
MLPVKAAIKYRETLPSQASVPYGAAIAAAGAMMLILQTWLLW